MILATAISALALAVFAAVAWSMWLDYRTDARLLDIVENAVKAGEPAPAELIARFTTNAPPRTPNTRRALARAAAAVVTVGVASFTASAFSTAREQEQAFLMIAAISGFAAILLLASYLYTRHARA